MKDSRESVSYKSEMKSCIYKQSSNRFIFKHKIRLEDKFVWKYLNETLKLIC